MTSLTLKRCPRCHLSFPATTDHFYRNGRDTLRARCIWCERQRKWESYRTIRRRALERIAELVRKE